MRLPCVVGQASQKRLVILGRVSEDAASPANGAAPRPSPTATRPFRPNPALPALPAPRLHWSRRPMPRRRPFYRPSREPPSHSRLSLSPVRAPAQPVCGERFVLLPECRAARSCAIRIRRRRREGGSRRPDQVPARAQPVRASVSGTVAKISPRRIRICACRLKTGWENPDNPIIQ